MQQRRDSRRKTARRRSGAFTGILLAGTCGVGQVRASPPSYHVTALGLTDGSHTGQDGSRRSRAAMVNAAGQVVGHSNREVVKDNSWVETSAWQYDSGVTTQIGLYDAQHTNANGFQQLSIWFLNDAGYTVGQSKRFAGNDLNGLSMWVYHHGVTVRAGLHDALHTNGDGVQESVGTTLNQAGQVAGVSTSFPISSIDPGQSAWLYDNGMTTRIGLQDAAHTHPTTARQESTPIRLNNAGQVLGSAVRYFPGEVNTTTAWLYSGGNTSILGLTTPEHIGTGGLQSGSAELLNHAGHVAGTSQRYAGGNSAGQSAWVFDGAATTNIGFTDAGHTASNGVRESHVVLMNQASQIAGHSTRYAGNDAKGTTAWLHSGGTTTPMGLYDAEHTSAFGDINNDVQFLNESGVVAGHTVRYSGASEPTGDSTWVHRAGITHRAGLLDPLHNNFGYHASTIEALNDAGLALGMSAQVSTTEFPGRSAWIYDAGTTTRIGLVDNQHTLADGMGQNLPFELNQAGQAIGIAGRYDASDNPQGNSGWFYDHATHVTTPLVFSTSAAGEAVTSPEFLTEGGVVLGTFRKFQGSSSSIEPFYWSLTDGFHELNAVVGDGGVAANGWLTLREAVGVAGANARHIIGQGLRSNFAEMGYLLSLPGGGAWINPAGGSWHGDPNWNLGAPPTAGDDAIFNLNSIYSVGFSRNAHAHDLNASAGFVLLDLFGHHLDIAGTTNVSAQLALVGGTLRTRAVNVTGQLDLGDSDMIVDYTGPSPLSAVTQLIATGKIMTSAFIEASSTLGIGDNSVLGFETFSGLDVDATSVLVKYTFHGDADLNGQVDVNDLGALASHWQSAGVWTDGDFDYNGTINVNDLGLLASNWQAGVGNPLGPTLNDALAALGLPSTAVPEPGLGAILGITAALKCHRRRRQSHRL